jgi:hypothetical protein
LFFTLSGFGGTSTGSVQSDAKEIAAEVVRGLRDSGFELQGKSPMD